MNLFWERLDARHDKASFESGAPELDFYLKNQAGQDVKRSLASVFVLTEGTGQIIGYYAISQASLTVNELPDNVAKKLPSKRSVPCTLLGRLAIDRRYRGQGHGKGLLFHVLKNQPMRLFMPIRGIREVIDIWNAPQ